MASWQADHRSALQLRRRRYKLCRGDCAKVSQNLGGHRPRRQECSVEAVRPLKNSTLGFLSKTLSYLQICRHIALGHHKTSIDDRKICTKSICDCQYTHCHKTGWNTRRKQSISAMDALVETPASPSSSGSSAAPLFLPSLW